MNLSKNKSIIYSVFKENPNLELDINDILKFINKEKVNISKRTVYRSIDKLIDMGKIYCSSVHDRKRKFKCFINYIMMFLWSDPHPTTPIHVPVVHEDLSTLYTPDHDVVQNTGRV